MNAGAPRPWPPVGRWRRTGPVLLLLAAVVAAGAVATFRSAPSTGTGTGGGSSASSIAGLPITYQTARRAGTAATYHWSAGCDHRTGRLRMPTVYAPPCVPRFRGANGGATWGGVTSRTITVVDYQPPPGDLAAEISGASGTPSTNAATAAGYVAMLNHIVELYGRHVVLVPYFATGTSDDAVAGRADAIKVAEQIHAFASIGGPAQTPAYQDELARLHVLCITCGYADTHSGFVQDAPYLWGLLPAPDTLLFETFRYVVHDLLHKDAVYAGEAAFRHERRVFATVSYTQEPPVYNALTEELAKFLAPTGLRVALQETYLLDVPELPSEAATIAAHLARVGATTVVFIGDPIMPIYLTRAAAAIGYYPEWVISGTVFTDTSTLGRYYDQREWSHAFGISALAVPTPIAQSDAYRLYRWYYGTVPPAPRTATVVLPGIEELFNGIELAGPHLTPSRYEQGLFRLPPAGGGTTTPLVAFGDQGAPPLPAYSSPADYTYIWYDASATGTDEEGVAGRGMVRFVDGGRRYASTTVPAQAVPMFVKAGSILQYPVPPPADRPPSYPPWPGSPVTRR